MAKDNKTQQAFTLTELLVVVTIIGLLALLATMIIKPWLQLARARDARRVSDIKLISTAVENYAGDNPCYPEEAVVNVCGGTGLSPYLNRIPCDPLTNNPYYYVRPDGCKEYALYADMEIDTEVDYGVGNYVVTSGNLVVAPEIVVVPTPTPTNLPIPTVPAITPTITPTPTGEYPECESSNNWACYANVCRRVLTCRLECQPKYAASNCYDQCAFGNEYSCDPSDLLIE